MQEVSHYPQHLVAVIEARLSRPLAPLVRAALLTVPRHRFIQHYYEHDHRQTAPSSQKGPDWEAWLASIYQDRVLTTQRDERGQPTSSSSQPGVMAVMLEHLAIEPGMRVLEIGTGTGYNAALLAVLAGDPGCVTTIDIDPALIAQALPCIEGVVGPGMTLHVGNGLEGYGPNAPYHRIIATGSTLPVPRSWCEQLQPEGRLVMDLRGPMSGGLMVLTKQMDGTIEGCFLADCRTISFIALRPSAEALATHTLPEGYQQLPIQEAIQVPHCDPAYQCAAHFCTYEQFHGQDDEVNLWLQWAFPGLAIRWMGLPDAMHPVLTDTTTQTIVTIQP